VKSSWIPIKEISSAEFFTPLLIVPFTSPLVGEVTPKEWVRGIEMINIV
jgi:hypothetical protein